MSVDDRLRMALERSAADFTPVATGRVESVIARARRRRTDRRIVGLAAAVVAVVALGIGSGVVVQRGVDGTAPPVPAAPVTPVPGPDATSLSRDPAIRAADADLAAGITGEWTTGLVSVEDATAAMVRTGTAAYREPVLAELQVPGAFTLTFDELAYRASTGGVSVDEGTWYIRDGRLVLVPNCDYCRIVLWPQLTDGVLRLTLLDDTSPDYQRMPSAAFVSVIYTSAAFRHS